ncbi:MULTISPECIES: hypothetical protein [Bradyrhizobium]|jgi:hypothetical protein|uniref:hypothetical protein n=1 Tax=Bradyrhizobium TaxID=374 RepID=UPI0015564284|nr:MULTISPECIES: hypothetical protein [unclassified Bradyrhizobium]MDU0959676.1 hypothetical protein [Bradyrhizobium sp.]MDU1497534.1 hypothetical protein [Bradyrhizobium sp.]MDU1547776.1 hypothetical protein [Bradyrhizobium sp.]MDU1689331.1 hypothetical protein [Bradyrhizobium sp.]MDU1807628.1 hypothetical protein [Bradyrhizobium sp.]
MRFFTSEKRIKRDARRLKNALAKHGYDVNYIRCLDLMARLHGFAHFPEWRNAIWDGQLSLVDEDVDDDTVELRFLHQEAVMAEAGLGAVAGVVLEPSLRGNEFLGDATSIHQRGSDVDA